MTAKIFGWIGIVFMLAFSIYGLSGSGTANDPYNITTCIDLQNLGSLTDIVTHNHYIMGNDIDCSESWNYTPYGFRSIGNITRYFGGDFNGKGFHISNITISRSTTASTGFDNYAAIFGYLNDTGRIRNLYVLNSSTTGYEQFGMVVGGSTSKGKTINISVENSQITCHRYCAAFAGNHRGMVDRVRAINNTVTANFIGSTFLGASTANVNNSYVADYRVISGTGVYRWARTVNTTDNSLILESLQGAFGSSHVFSSTSPSRESFTRYAGNYFTTATISQMQNISFYNDTWDFDDVWYMKNGSYPDLRWTLPPTPPTPEIIPSITGSGTMGFPYVLSHCNHLQNSSVFSTSLNYVTLNNSIDCSHENDYQPIRADVSVIFDGDGHTISNISHSNVSGFSDYHGGMFAGLSNSVFANVILEDITYNTSVARVGCIAGSVSDSIISNVIIRDSYAKGTSSVSVMFAESLNDNNISDISIINPRIIATSQAGSLIGFLDGGNQHISRISVINPYIPDGRRNGMIGWLNCPFGCLIHDVYTYGGRIHTDSNGQGGGIAGFISYSPTIYNAYSSTNVTTLDNQDSGALFGQGSSLANLKGYSLYWDINLTDEDAACGRVGNLCDNSTAYESYQFNSTINFPDFDFIGVWYRNESIGIPDLRAGKTFSDMSPPIVVITSTSDWSDGNVSGYAYDSFGISSITSSSSSFTNVLEPPDFHFIYTGSVSLIDFNLTVYAYDTYDNVGRDSILVNADVVSPSCTGSQTAERSVNRNITYSYNVTCSDDVLITYVFLNCTGQINGTATAYNVSSYSLNGAINVTSDTYCVLYVEDISGRNATGILDWSAVTYLPPPFQAGACPDTLVGLFALFIGLCIGAFLILIGRSIAVAGVLGCAILLFAGIAFVGCSLVMGTSMILASLVIMLWFFFRS